MSNQIQNPNVKKILDTIIYYDILDYPMTSFEIWKYLINDQKTSNKEQYEKIKLVDIIKELENEELRKKIEEYRGYYFLKGRKKLVEQRIERNKIAEKKFKKVRKIVKVLRFVPFVRMIAVTGRLAMKNTDKSSDLDLLVVLKHGHIFTGRTLVTLVTHLLGVRRYGQKISNRVCLNFFITDRSLKINLKDLFSSSEYYFIWPLYGYKTFKRFQEANSWIEDFRENYILEKNANLKLIRENFGARVIREIGEMIFSFQFIENWLRDWQMRRIMNDSRTHIMGSMVMADDNALIFLPEPQGPGVFEKFREKMKAV
ncbi:MAG: hypothetical protein WCV59_04525 [Parcubacteria group bacterium]|jgi:predicted nucleotidyltransferase